ncbi:XRE family transcriptional regulator [Crenobacter cavernae]|uniref:XRE family transcriptional regulator n=1 Tax=Crenobacter cavernae TaxID=2290923 RepID=A0A345Y3M9_9NEIS|nr:XRE family transcriptional regulator [Crenobacter cavernae]AXK38531.1 XRE family transcriptional regulator [Crenobacter cavernae]
MSTDKRLTPDEFKAEFKRRGWTGRALAARWGKSETWISKIASNPERDQHWDDAVRGLPMAK